MIIRKATLNDVDRISELLVYSWKDAYKGIFSQRFLHQLKPTHFVSSLKRDIQDKQKNIFVAEMNNTIVGNIAFGKHRKKQEGAEIYSLYVSPDYYRQGIATALIDTTLERLQLQYTDVDVYVVIQNNRAKNFYESMGFKNTFEIYQSEIDGGKFYTHIYNKKIDMFKT